MENKFKFENVNNFSILLIKPNNIDKLNWFDSDYTDKIINLDIYQDLVTNADNFIDIISEQLLISKYKDKQNLEVITQIVSEIPNYIFELLYVDKLNENDNEQNDVGSLLNTNGDKLYGNVILMKTFIPSLSKSIIIEDCYRDSVKNILDNRVNTNIVSYDGDQWSDIKVKGSLDDFAKEYFDDKFFKAEIPFLLHNINIWYETCDGLPKNLCGKLLDKPIYKCLWFTMINDEFRGNLYLDEVNKIIKISNVLDFPFSVNLEWIKEEKDEIDRDVIKNKYKVLNLAYSELIKY
jgi:hypothetical protein